MEIGILYVVLAIGVLNLLWLVRLEFLSRHIRKIHSEASKREAEIEALLGEIRRTHNEVSQRATEVESLAREIRDKPMGRLIII